MEWKIQLLVKTAFGQVFMRSSTSLTLQIRFYFNSFSKEQDYTALFCIQPFLLTQNHNAAILMNAKNQTRNFQRSRKEPQYLICEAKINSLELQPQTADPE